MLESTRFIILQSVQKISKYILCQQRDIMRFENILYKRVLTKPQIILNIHMYLCKIIL